MATTYLLVIIVFCVTGPPLAMAALSFPDASLFYPRFDVPHVNVFYNGSAFMNDDCGCVWLTRPSDQQSTTATYSNVYGGILSSSVFTFYREVYDAATNLTGTGNVTSWETGQVTFSSATPPIVQASPRPRPPRKFGNRKVASKETGDASGNLTLPPTITASPPPSPPSPPSPPPPRPYDSAASFLLYFRFTLQSRTAVASQGGGLCFLLTNRHRDYLDPSDPFSHFGVFPSLGTKTTAMVWALEFDTHQDLVVGDIDNNHVGINVNSARSVVSRSLRDIGIILYANYSISVWVEYNFPSRLLVVKIQKGDNTSKPSASSEPFLSLPNYDFTTIIDPWMYPGFAARGTDQDHIIKEWSFSTTKSIPPLNTAPTQPNPPPPVISSPPPPSPTPGIIIPGLGVLVEVGSSSFFAAWFLLFLIVCLLLRCTRRGQRILWRVYGKCKRCPGLRRLCNLPPCIRFCTLEYDANGKPRKNRGRPMKKKRLTPKPGKKKMRKPGAKRNRQAGRRKKAKGKGKGKEAKVKHAKKTKAKGKEEKLKHAKRTKAKGKGEKLKHAKRTKAKGKEEKLKHAKRTKAKKG